MERKWIAALAMGLVMLVGGAAQAGDSPTRQCVRDAAADKKACTQICKDDFLTAVDTCRGLNHDCAQAARDAREACVGDILSAMRDCVDEMCSVCDDEIDDCRRHTRSRSGGRDECIDGAQVRKFQCRAECRESVQLFSGLKACRDEFRAALLLCPVPTPLPE